MTSRLAYRPSRSDTVIGLALVLVVTYFALLSWAIGTWEYDRWMVLILVPVLLMSGVVIIVTVTSSDKRPMTHLILIALGAKIASSFVRYYVTFSIYGAGDALRYDSAGAELANAFHRGDLSAAELLAVGRGTRFMEDLTGVVYAAIGPSDLGGFLVFSWLSFWGLFLFLRAAMIGLPDANHRRYTLLVLFLPSLLFWPSSIGKESVMIFALGVCAYGSARILERRPLGWPVLFLGAGVCYLLRPHVIVVVLAALAVAILFRPRPGTKPLFGPTGRILTVVALMVALAFSLSIAADRILPANDSAGVEAVGDLLDRAESGTDEGGSEIDNPLPNSPLTYPLAVFTVLFRPTIIEARNLGGVLAAIETTIVLGLFIAGRHRLRQLPSLIFQRPYVMMCVVYTGVFAFAWSSFSNLGALARQRVQVWPFVLLLVSLPNIAGAAQRRAAKRRMPINPPTEVPTPRDR